MKYFLNISRTIYAVLFPILMAAGFPCAASTCDPDDFHAISDGSTLNTQALQNTIDQCSLHGGGIVALHKGVWLSGPLQLKNNVTLELMDGSVLKASNRVHDFKAAFIGHTVESGEAFILAHNVHDVAIIGAGTIDGNGEQDWWGEAKIARKKIKAGDTQYFSKKYPNIPVANGVPRPWLIEFDHVNHGRIGAILATNSPMWNIVLRDSENITVNGTRIRNPENAPNTDGIDVVASQHIQMSHLDIATGDDNITIKSGLVGDNLTQPSSDISIADSVMHQGHGVSVGSETAHGIGSVRVTRLLFDGTENGIRIKSARDRGAEIGPILVSKITMHNVNTPILITDSYGGMSGQDKKKSMEIAPVAVTETTPLIHDISINNLSADGAKTAAVLSGLPEAPLRNVLLDHVTISSQQGMISAYAQGKLLHVMIHANRGAAVSQGPQSYLIVTQ